MLTKILKLQGVDVLDKSTLVEIKGGANFDYCEDDITGYNSDCHRFDEGQITRAAVPRERY
jgi:hypothetical protein